MDAKANENEFIKAGSNYLRGTLTESIADELSGALAPADAQISKFHGFYEPYVAEIALIGKGPGRYNLLLGGDGKGQRLNRPFRENLTEADILETLDELFDRYSAERLEGETFGN